MSTSARKERERRERERRLLDVARGLLIEQGFAGLSMDRLAEATEYSKGTVYQHFSTKEDLVAALALQSNETRAELFGRAVRLDGRPRERMCAVAVADELFARLHPHYFRSELVIKMANLEERASAERREALQLPESRCCDLIRGVAQEAIDRGDLAPAEGVTAGVVTFAVLSLAVGAHMAMLSFRPQLQELGIAVPFASLRDNFHALLDGLGWRPLHAEWDYAGTYRRVAREVFADEWQRAGLG